MTARYINVLILYIKYVKLGEYLEVLLSVYRLISADGNVNRRRGVVDVQSFCIENVNTKLLN